MTNWDAIVADDGPMVWRTLWRLLTDRADVEECFQETFVAALKLSRRQPMECWSAALCSIATARGMDRLRSRYRQGGHRPRGASGEASAGRRLSEATSTEASPEQRPLPRNCPSGCARRLQSFPSGRPRFFISMRCAAGVIVKSRSGCK